MFLPGKHAHQSFVFIFVKKKIRKGFERDGVFKRKRKPGVSVGNIPGARRYGIGLFGGDVFDKTFERGRKQLDGSVRNPEIQQRIAKVEFEQSSFPLLFARKYAFTVYRRGILFDFRGSFGRIFAAVGDVVSVFGFNTRGLRTNARYSRTFDIDNVIHRRVLF